MDTVEILKQARALIERPNGWCQGEFVVEEVETDDGRAYCALGAVGQVTQTSPPSMMQAAISGSPEVAGRAVFALTRALGRRSEEHYRVMGSHRITDVAEFNDMDAHGVEDVLELFDRAIALELGQ